MLFRPDRAIPDKLNEYYRIATWSFIALAACYAILFRIYVAWDLPIWLDESWTAVLSSAPTIQSFRYQMWLDSNAPLYYLLIWLWPFEDTFGLRIPSIAFMLVASLIALFWRAPGIDRKQAALWACLLLLWFPASSLFLDARYYALLFALSTAQCVAFLRLDRAPSLRPAMTWVGLATLGILTHYFAAILAIAQGIFYLARHRGVAAKTWPALILTAPAFVWTAYHWPRLTLYGSAEFSWYGSASLRSSLNAVLIVVGDLAVLAGIAIAMFVFARRERPSTALAATIVPAGIAIVTYFVLGLSYPVLQPRYLIPLVPAILLAIALCLRFAGYVPITAWFLVNVGNPHDWKAGLTLRSNFGLEAPARYLADARSVTWMIDYPGSKIHVPWQMENMLKDGFARNGHKLAEARWGTDFEKGDALILIRRNGVAATVSPPRGWPCTTLNSNWGGHVTVVCTKPD